LHRVIFTKDEDFWQDPIKILQELFNADDILKKPSEEFNKGYPEDPDDKGSDYTPLRTNARKKIVILDSKVRNTIIVGGYKDNVNFPALDLEKRFGSENVLTDNLPNNYGMLVLDERCIQLYKRAKYSKGNEEAEMEFIKIPDVYVKYPHLISESVVQVFFLNKLVHTGFLNQFCLEERGITNPDGNNAGKYVVLKYLCSVRANPAGIYYLMESDTQT
jgi:hypothetical protein